MKTVYEIRLENMAAIIDSDFGGSPCAFAAAIGVRPTQITRLYSGADSRRNMGASLARRIETSVGIGFGALDHAQPETEPTTMTYPTVYAEVRIDTDDWDNIRRQALTLDVDEGMVHVCGTHAWVMSIDPLCAYWLGKQLIEIARAEVAAISGGKQGGAACV